MNHLKDDRLIHDISDEELSLQVNLDYHPPPSRSFSSSQNDSPFSIPSPIPDRSPIVAIDEYLHESKTDIQSAPMANVDDDDEEEEDVPMLTFDQPVLSPIPLKNLFQMRNDNRQTEIAHDIIHMRHLFNEHENDDEFLAVMHNPTVFEEVLYVDDDQQQVISSS